MSCLIKEYCEISFEWKVIVHANEWTWYDLFGWAEESMENNNKTPFSSLQVG